MNDDGGAAEKQWHQNLAQELASQLKLTIKFNIPPHPSKKSFDCQFSCPNQQSRAVLIECINNNKLKPYGYEFYNPYNTEPSEPKQSDPKMLYMKSEVMPYINVPKVVEQYQEKMAPFIALDESIRKNNLAKHYSNAGAYDSTKKYTNEINLKTYKPSAENRDAFKTMKQELQEFKGHALKSKILSDFKTELDSSTNPGLTIKNFKGSEKYTILSTHQNSFSSMLNFKTDSAKAVDKIIKEYKDTHKSTTGYKSSSG